MKFLILSDEKTTIERTLKIRVESESIGPVWNREVARIAKETTVPGFRYGKAPGRVVERHIGREDIWLRVRELVAQEVIREVLRDAEPKPLTPPSVEFDKARDEVDNSPDVWEPGKGFEFTVTYLPSPPTPEDIERDLMRRAGAEMPDLPSSEQPESLLPGGLPPDPRAQIPGSGIPREPSPRLGPQKPEPDFDPDTDDPFDDNLP